MFSFSIVDCGAAGLYGQTQKHWYLTEEGLKFNDSRQAEEPKEPKEGFQLFTVNRRVEEKNDGADFDLSRPVGQPPADSTSAAAADRCFSLFDFNRIDLVEKFSTNFVLQGRSWYTKWVTVSTRFPVVTRYR